MLFSAGWVFFCILILCACLNNLYSNSQPPFYVYIYMMWAGVWVCYIETTAVKLTLTHLMQSVLSQNCPAVIMAESQRNTPAGHIYDTKP